MASTEPGAVTSALKPAALAEAAIRDAIGVHERLLETPGLAALVKASRLVTSSLSQGGKLLVFGNGGSASDAAHIAAEFVGRFQRDRAALPALSLVENVSAVTAIANDYGFEHVFARQLEAHAVEGDVALAISTSGESANVLAGVRTARRLGIGTIGLTGAGGGELTAEVDVCLRVPSSDTARIQEGHILLAHVLCQLAEHDLG